MFTQQSYLPIGYIIITALAFLLVIQLKERVYCSSLGCKSWMRTRAEIFIRVLIQEMLLGHESLTRPLDDT